MCSKVKRYKGKDMGTFFGTKEQQKACLEGDTNSEEKVKKVLQGDPAIGPGLSS
jgi:hypothetical protein